MIKENDIIDIAKRLKKKEPDKTFYVVKLQSGCFEIMENIDENKKKSLDERKVKYKIIKTL